MNMSIAPRLATAALIGCISTAGAGLLAQTGATGGEWRAYGGDTGHTRYAPLDQINAANFGTLTLAWRFKTDHLGHTRVPGLYVVGDASRDVQFVVVAAAEGAKAAVAINKALQARSGLAVQA